MTCQSAGALFPNSAPHPVFGDILPLRQQAAETRKKVVDQLQGGAFILMQVCLCGLADTCTRLKHQTTNL